MPAVRVLSVAAFIPFVTWSARGQTAFFDAGGLPFPSWTSWSWTAGDVTQDGRADLLVFPIQSSQGTPVLIAGVPPAYTTYPNPFPGLTHAGAVAAGDVNNDGHRDVVVSDGSIKTCLAVPGGGFQPAVTSAPALAYDLQLVDWNGDGNLDLAGQDTHALRIRFGAGDGTFSGGVDIPAPFLLRFRSADVDQDGDPDLLVLLSASPIAIHENLGGGVFGPGSMPAGVLAITGPFDVGDVDGDGWPDLVHCFPITTQAYLGVAFNDHAGGFVPGPLTWVAAYVCASQAADLDIDGRADVFGWTNFNATPSGPPSGVMVHAYGSPLGISPPGPAVHPPIPNVFWGFQAADADADGDIDFFPVAPGSGRVLLNLRNGLHSSRAGPYFGGCQPLGPRLSFNGSTAPGASFALVVVGAPPLASGFFLAGPSAAQIPIHVPGCILAVGGPSPFAAPLAIDAAGGATLPFAVPATANLSGVRAFGQVVAFSASAAGGLAATNGLMLVF